MTISDLWLRDFRCFREVHLAPDPDGLTILHGANGAGKTSLLEAIGWLATLRSIRGASRETVIRTGSLSSILRAETVGEQRASVVEIEIRSDRNGRCQLNHQVVRRRSDLSGALRVSVFSPADRSLVEGGPAERRAYLDDFLAGRQKRLEALVDEVAHILRQRAALLRQSSGRLDSQVLDTLDVWDSRLAISGTQLASEREALASELEPLVDDAYSHFDAGVAGVSLGYRRSWSGELIDALVESRRDDLRRQITSVGPHRDELEIVLGQKPARTHGSQGEQRCIALALRLATHELSRRSAPEPPVLLLDDVFSELDDRRSQALVELLPAGQVLLTTATSAPEGVGTGRMMELVEGRLAESVGT